MKSFRIRFFGNRIGGNSQHWITLFLKEENEGLALEYINDNYDNVQFLSCQEFEVDY